MAASSNAFTGAGPSSSITAAEAEPTSPWTNRRHLSAKDIILRPLQGSIVREDPDLTLFLPAGAQRRWYTGFLKHWSEYQKSANTFWAGQRWQSAFDEIKGIPIPPPAPADPSLMEKDHPSTTVARYILCEAIDIVNKIYNLLLETQAMQGSIMSKYVGVSFGEEEDICRGKAPAFFIEFLSAEGQPVVEGLKEEAHMVGHVELLGGRPGALTWAVQEQKRNTWGSLRSVLGKCSPHNIAWRASRYNH